MMREEIRAAEAAIAASDARLRVWRAEARRTWRERLRPSKRTLVIGGVIAGLVGGLMYRRRQAVARAWGKLERRGTVMRLLRGVPLLGTLLPLWRMARNQGLTRERHDDGPPGDAGSGMGGRALLASLMPLLGPVVWGWLRDRMAHRP